MAQEKQAALLKAPQLNRAQKKSLVRVQEQVVALLLNVRKATRPCRALLLNAHIFCSKVSTLTLQPLRLAITLGIPLGFPRDALRTFGINV